MRIAYVCADPGIAVGGTKGAAVHLRSLAAALASRGHEVLLVCARSDGPNPLPAGVSIVTIPTDASATRLSDTVAALRVDAVLERYALVFDSALHAAARLGIRSALEVNAPLVDEAVRYRGLQGQDVWRQREHDLLSLAQRIVVVSSALRRYIEAAGADPASIVMIPNGVDPELFSNDGGAAVRARWGLDSNLVIGFAGSLKPWHGVRILLQAGRALPSHARILVVGDGPERSMLEAVVANDQDLRTKVIFTGAVAHTEMPAYLKAMDVAVAPFEHLDDFYFSPLKVTEYMASGLPVVASRQGDLPQLLGDSGMLVKPGDHKALGDALLVLARDPNLRQRLGKAGQIRARAMSWASVARRVEGVLAAGDPREGTR